MAGIGPDIKVGADISGAAAKIYLLRGQITQLQGILTRLRISADDSAAVAKIGALQAQVARLMANADNLVINADTAIPTAKIGLLRLQLDKLYAAAAAGSQLGLDIAPVEAKIALVQAQLARLTAQKTVQIDVDAAGFAALMAQMTALTAETKALAGDGGGGGFGALVAAMGAAAFGAGNLRSIWTGTIGAVGLWHVALDGVIEGLIIFAGVAAAAAVGIAVMLPAINNLHDHLIAVNTASQALGTDIPPLTSKFDALQRAMAPQTIEIYGAAINIIEGNMGHLAQIAPRVVTLFDDIAARLVMFTSGFDQSNGIVQAGIGFMQQLAGIMGTLLNAITNLLHSDPGIARFLLDAVQGIATLIDLFSKLPAPIVEATLALHGAWVWGNVLAGALGAVGKSAVRAAVGLAGLAANPFFWVAAAVAGIAYLITQMGTADRETQQFIANMNSALNNLSASQAITQISYDIGQLGTQMKTQFAGDLSQAIGFGSQWGNSFKSVVYDAQASWQDFTKSFHDTSGILAPVRDQFKALWDLIDAGSGRTVAAANDMKAYTGEIVRLSSEQKTLFGVTGDLVKQGYSVAQSFALMDLAGVKAGDGFQLAVTKVQDLITGYENVVGQGGILSNSMNAVTFQALLQDSKVQQLTQAWDTFFGVISGGASTFVNFAQSVNTMNEQGITAAQNLAQAQLQVNAAQVRFTNDSQPAVASTQALTAAQDRLTAAEDRLNSLQGVHGATAAQLASAQGAVARAQDRLNTLMKEGGASALALTAAQDRLTASEDKLASLEKSHTATAAQLASAHASVASAQDALNKLMKQGGASALQLAGAQDTLRSAEDRLRSLQQGHVATSAQLASAQASVASAQSSLNNLQTQGTGTSTSLASSQSSLSSALTNLAQAQRAAQISNSGLNDASLTMRQNFLSAASAAQKQLDALTQQATAAHLGAQGTNLLTQAGKDMLAVMLPAAKGSQQLTAILYALAQQAGYTGADSFKSLQDWVGKSVNPMKNLDNITTTLTTDSANLNQDVKNLSVALGQTLTNAMATAAFQATGGQQVFDNFATALVKTGINSQDTHDKAQKLANALYTLTGTTQQAHSEFIAFAHDALGVTAAQAEKLWKEVLPGLQKEMDSLHGKTFTIMMKGNGTFTIHGEGDAFNFSAKSANGTVNAFPVKGAAAGMLVSHGTGPRADDVLVRVSKGETIVPAHLTPQIAPWARAQGIPGFAGGGLIGSGIQLQGAPSVFSGQFGAQMQSAFEGAMGNSMASQMLQSASTVQSALGGTAGAFGAPGGSVRRWLSTVVEALSMLHLSRTLANQVLYQMQTESGGNPAAINLWDCLSTDSGILTRRGWLKHDEVRIGDETIGYNAQTGRSEWTRVTRVVHHDDAPVLRVGNKRWAVEATPNHRWLTISRTGRAGMRETGSLGQASLVLASPADTGAGLPVTDQEAALLGWIAGDGSVSFAAKNALQVSIGQSKREHFAAIEAALDGLPHRRYAYPQRTSSVTWMLAPGYARDLIQRAGHPKRDAEQIMRCMSASQRRAWLGAMIGADGTYQGAHCRVFQADGGIAGAIRLAIYLEGHRPSQTLLAGKDQWAPCYSIGMTRPRISPYNRQVRDAGRGRVWCVTTELGTWTAGTREGLPFLTGNSNAAAGDPSRGLMQVIGSTFAAYHVAGTSDNIYDPLANITAALNYALHVYGPTLMRGGMGLGSGHGYAMGGLVADNGTVLSPGWNMRYNATGGPEHLVRGNGQVTVIVQNNGIIGSEAETKRWLLNGINSLATSGKLAYALKRSPSAN